MDKLTFYFDRNFGKRIPGAISKLRPPFGVKWHQGEGFRQGMPDDEWLEKVGKAGWIVITQDYKFHKIEHEVKAIRAHNVKCFYFPGANDGLWTTLCLLTKFHAKLLSEAQRNNAPFVFKLQGTGRLVNILS